MYTEYIIPAIFMEVFPIPEKGSFSKLGD